MEHALWQRCKDAFDSAKHEYEAACQQVAEARKQFSIDVDSRVKATVDEIASDSSIDGTEATFDAFVQSTDDLLITLEQKHMDAKAVATKARMQAVGANKELFEPVTEPNMESWGEAEKAAWKKYLQFRWNGAMLALRKARQDDEIRRQRDEQVQVQVLTARHDEMQRQRDQQIQGLSDVCEEQTRLGFIAVNVYLTPAAAVDFQIVLGQAINMGDVSVIFRGKATTVEPLCTVVSPTTHREDSAAALHHTSTRVVRNTDGHGSRDYSDSSGFSPLVPQKSVLPRDDSESPQPALSSTEKVRHLMTMPTGPEEFLSLWDNVVSTGDATAQPRTTRVAATLFAYYEAETPQGTADVGKIKQIIDKFKDEAANEPNAEGESKEGRWEELLWEAYAAEGFDPQMYASIDTQGQEQEGVPEPKPIEEGDPSSLADLQSVRCC